MPYEYRKLTPQEKDEILNLRRERGYPLHGPPHPFRETGFYLISAANFEHLPIMSTPVRRTDFESLLLDHMKQVNAGVLAWVVLPNHYHLLVEVEMLDQISQGLRHLHGTSARAWNMEDAQTGKRRVWYKFSDRMIRNEGHLYKTINYIHVNPVKHGYVTDVYDWPWSSLWMYFDQQGKSWLQDIWKKYPPGGMGEGWDD